MDWKHTPSTRALRPSEKMDVALLQRLLEATDKMNSPVMTPADTLGRWLLA